MNRRIGVIPAGIAVLAALVVGAGSSWALTVRMAMHYSLGLALAHELETTGLCTNSLQLHNADDRDRLARLLEQRLDSAVAQAMELTDHGARLVGPAPNLRESVRRAAIHYAATGEGEKQHRAETLLARLQGNHD